MTTFPGCSARRIMAGWLLWTVSIMEEFAFYSYWNRHFLWIWISFHWAECLCQTILYKLTGMPYLLSWYATQHCFWSRNLLHRKCCVQWGHAQGIHSFHVPHHPEAACWTEQCNGLLKSWLHCQVGDNTCGARTRFFQENVYVLNENHIFVYRVFSPIARIHESKNQRRK